MTTSLTKLELFVQYNKARAAARRGDLDEIRVNRALGLLLCKDGGERPPSPERTGSGYNATIRSCDCPDSVYSGEVCKHRVVKMIEARIAQSQERERAILVSDWPTSRPVSPVTTAITMLSHATSAGRYVETTLKAE